MRVALGKKGDYSVRAVIDVARRYGDGRRKAREIADEMDIPARYVPQILANLVRCELLTGLRQVSDNQGQRDELLPRSLRLRRSQLRD